MLCRQSNVYIHQFLINRICDFGVLADVYIHQYLIASICDFGVPPESITKDVNH